jgi:hypothetical protein
MSTTLFRTESTERQTLDQKAAEFLASSEGQHHLSDRRKGVLPESVTGPTIHTVVADVQANVARVLADTVGREVTAHGPRPGNVEKKEPDADEEEDSPGVAYKKMVAKKEGAASKTPSRKDRARGAK